MFLVISQICGICLVFVYLIHVWSCHQVSVEIKLQLQVLINNVFGQRGLSLPLVRGQWDRGDWNSVPQLRENFVSLTSVPQAAVPHLPAEVDVDWNCYHEDWRQ